MLVKHADTGIEYFAEEAKKTITQQPMADEQVYYIPYIETGVDEIRYLQFIYKDGNWNLREGEINE